MLCSICTQCIKRQTSKGSNAMLNITSKSAIDVDFPPEEFHMPSFPKKERQRPLS